MISCLVAISLCRPVGMLLTRSFVTSPLYNSKIDPSCFSSRTRTDFQSSFSIRRGFRSTSLNLASKSPYDVLNVSKTATVAEIKEAYYALAKKYHPDVNKTDKDASKKFNEIREAYEILSNEEKRRAFDATGYTGSEQEPNFGQGHPFGGFGFNAGGRGGPGGAFTMEDIFGNFEEIFSQGRRPSGPARGRNVNLSLDVTFMEAAKGTEKTVMFNNIVACKTCKGSGAKPGTSPSQCAKCHGSGHETMNMRNIHFQRTCTTCEGTGQVIQHKCTSCGGQGRLKEKRSITVEVPPGVDVGTTLQFNEQGEAGEQGGPPGHLFVTLNVLPSSIFKREGSDLYTEVHIPLTTAVLGGKVQVNTLEGKQEATIPSGTQPLDKIILRNQGLKKINSSFKGHLFVTVKIDIPKQVTDKQKELLKQFEEAA